MTTLCGYWNFEMTIGWASIVTSTNQAAAAAYDIRSDCSSTISTMSRRVQSDPSQNRQSASFGMGMSYALR